MMLMRVVPGFLGAWLWGSVGRELTLGAESVVYTRAGKPVSVLPLHAIIGAAAKPGIIWSAITISTNDVSVVLNGVVKSRARQFIGTLREAISRFTQDTIASHAVDLKRLAESLRLLMAGPRYVSNRDIELWKENIGVTDQSLLVHVLAIFNNPLLPREGISQENLNNIDLLADMMSGTRVQIRERNNRFVHEEMLRFKDFFDRVEKTPLTIEQRIASVVFEDRNLLVAAAGSGKTSTVVGKIGYSLLTRQYQPSDILVLAFNNDAARELEERTHSTLRTQLPKGERINAKTFHALGLEIMAIASGKKPSVANFAEGGEASDAVFVSRLGRNCMRSDPEFAADWMTFRTLCFKPARNPSEFGSIDEWNAYVCTNGETRNGKSGFLTIQGEIVKSQGELAIANWLYLQGVEYAYERPYEYDTADQNHRQYRPDFYFPAIKTYLEHYALDENGQPPAAFGARYLESMQWKAQLHDEKATALITTTFSEFVSGKLFPKLEQELKTRGQKFSPRPIDVVLKELNTFQRANYGSFLRTAMKHAKSNQVDEATLQSRADSNPAPFRARVFGRILWKLLVAYQTQLRENNEIDFEDMIIEAARDVAAHRYKHNFKLILVDECQDLSRARAKLLKALLTQAPDCKLFAVGDDWQSIYRFAGSDIDVFTHFASYFGVTATNFLTQTFRSNQGITDIAATFVQKNPSQMRKRVQA